MADCAAKTSFCSALIVTKIHVDNHPKLLEKIATYSVTENLKAEANPLKNNDLTSAAGKLQKKGATNKKGKSSRNIGFVSAEKTSDSLEELSLFVFKRDFAQLNSFTGKEKIGVIFAPPIVIPKNPINLFPDQLENAKKMAYELDGKELQRKIYSAQQEYPGFKPEFDLMETLKKALKDCDGVLVIHSSELRNPDLKKLNLQQEFDFIIIDLRTITVFAIEVKKTLGFHRPPNKKKEKALNVAEKVGKQLTNAYEFMREWFGGDLSVHWTFKPMIYCSDIKEELRNLCDNCTAGTACGPQDFLGKFTTYRRNNAQPQEIQMQVVKEFKLLARYLLFGLAARELPTIGHFTKKVNQYMDQVGDWQTIKLWCFLTPHQMEILEHPYVVFCSGWGGGKTTTGIEAVKRWSDLGMSVLILLNSLMTGNTEILLVHHVRNILRQWKPEGERKGFIRVYQVNFNNSSVENLARQTRPFDCVFVDEFPGTFSNPESSEFKTNIDKSRAVFGNKKRAWISISNYDQENELSITELYTLTEDFFARIEMKLHGSSGQQSQFHIFKGLDLNLRNPNHIKDSVDSSFGKFDDQGRNLSNETIQALNMVMKRPPNFIGNVAQNPKQVIKQVLKEKSMRAIIVTRNQDDAYLFGTMLQKIFIIDAVILSKWTLDQMGKERMESWLNGQSNLLVTSKKLVNGFECETIISVEDVDEDVLGDVISRATNQFVNFHDFRDFLMDRNNGVIPCSDGAIDFLDCFSSVEMRLAILQTFKNKLKSYQIAICDFHRNSTFMEERSSSSAFEEKKSPFGVMKIVMDAVTLHKCCVELNSICPKEKQTKSLTFCTSEQTKHNVDGTVCQRKVEMACSVNQTFLLLMPSKEENQCRGLPSMDLFQSLRFIKAKSYCFSIQPNQNVDLNHLKVLVNNNDKSFISAIKKIHTPDMTILFLAKYDNCYEFCNALHIRLKGKKLKDKYFFRAFSQLSQFLESLAEPTVARSKLTLKGFSSLKIGKGKRPQHLLIDLTKDPSVYPNIKSDRRPLLLYFKCPMTSVASTKLLEILETHGLYNDDFKGQDSKDLLNWQTWTNYITKTDIDPMQIAFLEFGLEFEQNWQSCLSTLVKDLSKKDIEKFENISVGFWTNCRNWDDNKSEMFKKTTFRKYFQEMANVLMRNISVVTLVGLKNLDDPLLTKANVSSRNYVPTSGNIVESSQLKKISFVHVFDENLERNGFITQASNSAGGNILIAGGWRNNNASSKAEIVDKYGNSKALPELPLAINFPSGAFFMGQPFICGEFSRNGGDFKTGGCYRLSMSANGLEWKELCIFQEELQRPEASSVILEQKIWISGGAMKAKNQYSNVKLKSSVFLDTNGKTTQGPDLSEPLIGHTSVKVHDSVLVIGGSEGILKRKNTRIYNMKPAFVKEGPPLNFARSHHGCCSVASNNHEGRNVIIVAGGRPEFRSVELWDHSRPESSWQIIKDLPEKMPWRPALHPHPDGDGVIIIYGEHTFKLVMQNGEYWYEKLDYHLQHLRESFFSMAVPDKFVDNIP